MTRGARWSLRIAVLSAAVVILAVAWRAGLFHLHDMTSLRAKIETVQRVPHLALIFIVAYALCAAVGVPASPFTLAGGALFGLTHGIAINWIGANVAALLGFAGARVLAGSRADRAQRIPAQLRKLTEAGAPMLLFRLRLIPVVPFALLNFGAALSSMSVRAFAVATATGIIPITVIYTMFAASLVAGVAGSGGRAFVVAMVSAMAIIAVTLVPKLFGTRGG